MVKVRTVEVLVDQAVEMAVGEMGVDSCLAAQHAFAADSSALLGTSETPAAMLHS